MRPTRNGPKTVCSGTSASFRRSAWVRRSSSIICTACPSMDIRTRRALTRAWTRTRACMHLSVTAACFLTCRPRTRAWSLTTPFKALKALLAYNFSQNATPKINGNILRKRFKSLWYKDEFFNRFNRQTVTHQISTLGTYHTILIIWFPGDRIFLLLHIA